MQLITEEIHHRLLRNAHEPDPGDQVPVCKLFDPSGPATWLLTRMDPEQPHRLFGLCDLGVGYPEVGTVDLRELETARGALGLPIERDRYFRARHGLAVCTFQVGHPVGRSRTIIAYLVVRIPRKRPSPGEGEGL